MDIIENQSLIEYEFKIDPTLPAEEGSINSNKTETDLIIGELKMVKTVNKQYATIGDILEYKVVLTNIGNILLTDIVFTDIIPNGATFVEGSVEIDEDEKPTFDPNDGFSLGSMIILDSKTITFKAEITSLPSPNIIVNQASTTFKYLVVLPVEGSSSSDQVTTTVNVSNISAVKSSNLETVSKGDTLIYTVVITNNGNIDATDVFFTDLIPSELTFVEGSVEIDEEEELTFDPNDGFDLGTLTSGNSITVTFEATVN